MTPQEEIALLRKLVTLVQEPYFLQDVDAIARLTDELGPWPDEE